MEEEEKVHRLLGKVEKEPIPTPERRPEEMVPVWPDLVVIEFLAVVVFSLGLILTSWFINAPLLELANPELAPNPAKAPWYFVNLQELLVHMDAGLAGVIVPAIALLLLMLIPYIDGDRDAPVGWFVSRKELRIALFSAAYAGILMIALVLFDEFLVVKRLLGGAQLGFVLSGWVIPIAVMLGLPVLLGIIVRRRWSASRREVLVALFTGFIMTYITLTVIGSAFRGPGFHLYWPWAMPPAE